MTTRLEPSRRFAVWLAASLVVLAMGGTHGQAAGRGAVCAVSSRVAGAEIGPMQRQLAALRAVRRAQGCAASGMIGAFFNGCRDLDGRVAALQRRLDSLGASGCVPERAPRRAKRLDEVSTRPSGGGDQGVRASRGIPVATMCVRLSDGHFFPSPNSGYRSTADATKILAQCQFICDTPEMAVYEVVGEERDVADMVSLRDGSRYAALRTGRRAAEPGAAGRCDTSRYYRRIAEIEAGRLAERERRDRGETLGFGGAVPIPRFRPSSETMVSIQAAGEMTGAIEGPNRVRIVGAAYFPEDAEREFAGGALQRVMHPASGSDATRP